MNAHPELSFLTFSFLHVKLLWSSISKAPIKQGQSIPSWRCWGLCCGPQQRAKSKEQRAGTQLPCLASPPPSLPGSCVHTSALLPLKWLLFWKRAERISAPVWSTYWKCLTDSQQLLGYLRLREWWVIEVFFTSGMPDPVSLCTQWRQVICKPSVKIYNRWSIFFFTSAILAVSLKCPFALIGGVSKGRECYTLHPLWEGCRASLSTRPAEIVLRPDLFLHSPSEICCITQNTGLCLNKILTDNFPRLLFFINWWATSLAD